MQSQIHVASAWQSWKQDEWSDCSNVHYTHQYTSESDNFQYLLQPFNEPGLVLCKNARENAFYAGGSPRKLHIMIYNGDVDVVCNFLGDEWFGHMVAKNAGLSVCSI